MEPRRGRNLGQRREPAGLRPGDLVTARLLQRLEWVAQALQPMPWAAGRYGTPSMYETVMDAQRELSRARQVEAVLRYEVEKARASYGATVKILVGIHAVIYPQLVKLEDGRRFAFNSPHLHQQMQELSDRIRAIPDELAKAAPKPGPFTLPADPDPATKPAGSCTSCGQRNSGWCNECGRCETTRSLTTQPPPENEMSTSTPNELRDSFDAAARPLIKWLCDNVHPHHTAIITPTGAELVEGVASTGPVHDYLRD
jgi:hypothetical protein